MWRRRRSSVVENPAGPPFASCSIGAKPAGWVGLRLVVKPFPMGKLGSKSNSSPTFPSSSCRNREGLLDESKEVDSMVRRRSMSKSSPNFCSSSCPRSSEVGREEVSYSNSTITRRSKSESSPTSLSPSWRVGPASLLDECQEDEADALPRQNSLPAFNQLPREIKVMVFNLLPPFSKFSVFYNDLVKSFIPDSLEGFSLIARYEISKNEYAIARYEISNPEFGIAKCCLGKLQNEKEATIPNYISKVGSKYNYSLSHTDRIVCSAEGLVCVEREKHAIILNPTDPNETKIVGKPNETMKVLGFGFGFKINEGFKLIAMDNKSKNPYQLYKSNSRSWKKNLQGPGDFVHVQPGKYLNGNIYFLAQKSLWKNKISSVHLVLLQFNCQSEMFDLPRLPEPIVQMKLGDVHIEPIYKRLAISCKNDESTDVWIANDDGLWIKAYKFHHCSSALLFVLSHDQVLVKREDRFRLLNPITSAAPAVLHHLKVADSTICFKSHFSP